MAIILHCGAGGDLRLLPAFLAHYRRLGIASILLTVHLRSEDPTVASRLHELANRFSATLASVWIDHTLSHERRALERADALATYARPEDWVVSADLDEFHEYPLQIDELVKYCENRGFDHVLGELVDRLAEDGSFPALDVENLWEQFPYETRLTRNILHGDDQKVVLARVGLSLSPGYHRVLPAETAHVRCDLQARVHHFKWDESVTRRLRSRVVELKQSGCDWWGESDAFVSYVARQGGVVDLSDPALEARMSRFEPQRVRSHGVAEKIYNPSAGLARSAEDS